MESYIRNIVFACPDPRALGSFYAELLGMRIIREDWLVIARDESSFPRLAFGNGSKEYRPPRWPDPEHPQQLHLDLPVSNLEAAEEVALRLGATPLQDKGDHRSYADPVGHPFCLYRDAAQGEHAGRPLSGRIGRVVYDCFSPRALARPRRDPRPFGGAILRSPRRLCPILCPRGPSVTRLSPDSANESVSGELARPARTLAIVKPCSRPSGPLRYHSVSPG